MSKHSEHEDILHIWLHTSSSQQGERERQEAKGQRFQKEEGGREGVGREQGMERSDNVFSMYSR